MATSSPAGCFVLLGSPATASLVATGAPPRHVKTMLEFPAGFLVSSFKGGQLAVAVAAGAAVPGGSGDDRPLYREAASNISSSPAGRFGVHGALAGVQLPRYSLIAAGAPPRHVKALAFPAGFLASNSKGGRLAAVAAGAASPGESDDGLPWEDCEAASNISSFPAGRFIHGALAGVQLPRYSLIAAGAPPRHVKALALPAGFLASNSSKGGRLAVVVAAGAASPGESDDGLPSEDCEAAVSAFRLEMELFKFSQRPVALVGSPTDLLMDGASGTAKDCTEVLEFLLARVPVHRDTLKELISVGQAFLTVESQAKEGYVKADALANSIQGLKLVGKTFFDGVDLPEYSAPMVPLSADDVDKDSFFKELINIFIVLYTALYWEARKKYGFSTGGTH